MTETFPVSETLLKLAVVKRKEPHSCPFRELNPGRPARSLVSILTGNVVVISFGELLRYKRTSYLFFISNKKVHKSA
jgi:hypothetical protein